MQRARKAWTGLARLCAEYGRSRLSFFLDLIWCRVRYQVDLTEYDQYRFPTLSAVERARIVPARVKPSLEAKYNGTQDIYTIRDKAVFLQRYSAFVHRAWLDCRAADEHAVLDFLTQHPDVIVKPVQLQKGEGIRRERHLTPAARLALSRTLANTPSLLEERIFQSPDLAQLNDDASVNTVRVLAVRDRSGTVHLLGATLRVGVKGTVTDNFAGGGIAYPIDLPTGTVRAAGVDISKAHYLRHPGSGQIMPGFQIPHWGAMEPFIRAAMDILPSVRYVGWDVAILDTGLTLIEGNDDAAVRTIQLVREEGGLLADLQKYV